MHHRKSLKNNEIYQIFRKIGCCILLLVTTFWSPAQSYSTIIIDKQRTATMGAEDLATMHKALYSFQDRHIPDTLFRENTFLQKSAGFGCRMARLLLLDAQEDEFISLVQHEVFGHGARLRELGYEKNAYGLNMFFPFGDGHGFAQYGTLQSGYQYPTIHERIAVDIAGVDAQILLGSTITEQALLDDSLHFRQGVLYLVSQNFQRPILLAATAAGLKDQEVIQRLLSRH